MCQLYLLLLQVFQVLIHIPNDPSLSTNLEGAFAKEEGVNNNNDCGCSQKHLYK